MAPSLAECALAATAMLVRMCRSSALHSFTSCSSAGEDKGKDTQHGGMRREWQVYQAKQRAVLERVVPTRTLVQWKVHRVNGGGRRQLQLLEWLGDRIQ